MRAATHFRLGLILAGLLVAGCGGDDGDSDSGMPPEDGSMSDTGVMGSCTDDLFNQDESDVDCGGICGATCVPGEVCVDGDDCTTGNCLGEVCGEASSCSDGAQNGSESDVDCGGPMCSPCGDGAMCGDGADCTSMVCTGGACTAPMCGDGFDNTATEDCDGDGMGAGGESATCDSDCTTAECGDSTLNATAGEQCEEGGVETATCDPDCTTPECGDGYANTAFGERCDGDGAGTGGETAACNTDCSVSMCGDGIVNSTAAEVCDGNGAGMGGETSTCNIDCTTSMCGDGVLNPTAGETCDDGNTMDGDRCPSSCIAPPSVTISGTQTFDTDTGLLDGMVTGSWDRTTFTLSLGALDVPAGARLNVVGSNPLIVEAAADITVAGVVDAAGENGTFGPCNRPGGVGGAGGPGGFAGGDGGDGAAMGATPPPGDTPNGQPGMGPGAGGAGLVDGAGGGGAGHIGTGADGVLGTGATGSVGRGGSAYSGITPFRGGSGGGGGSGEDDAPIGLGELDDGGGGGGGGGGAIRLDAFARVTVTGTVDVSGGNGGSGCPNAAGSGGGGSGGTIVIFSRSAADVTMGRLDIDGGVGPAAGGDGGDGAIGEVFIDGSCSDGVRNQDESDVDCGGSICGACGPGGTCGAGADCMSGTCSLGTCVAVTCIDGTMNGTETDVDCGGAACVGCFAGQACGAGTDCLSAGCTGGACDPDGHTVLFGHDFFARNADIETLIGNSVLLTAETGVIDILVYDEFGDLGAMGEVNKTEAAITTALTAAGRSATFTRLSDFTVLTPALTTAVDVLLIAEQESGTATVMDSIGAAWRTDMEAFLDRGGVIILCTWVMDPGWRIFDAAGLMRVTGVLSVNGATLTVVDPTSAIATGVSATYTGENGSARLLGIANGTTVVEAGLGQPVLQHRVRGLP